MIPFSSVSFLTLTYKYSPLNNHLKFSEILLNVYLQGIQKSIDPIPYAAQQSTHEVNSFSYNIEKVFIWQLVTCTMHNISKYEVLCF